MHPVQLVLNKSHSKQKELHWSHVKAVVSKYPTAHWVRQVELKKYCPEMQLRQLFAVPLQLKQGLWH